MKIIFEKDQDSAKIAAASLRQGKAIAFASDTVYGVAVDASNPQAVELLYSLKKRDPKKPIAIFLPDIFVAQKIFDFDDLAQKISAKFFPGSLTLVLKQKEKSSVKLAQNLNSDTENFLGFRIIDSQFVQELLRQFGGILAVTSANPAGAASAISAKEVEEYFTNSDLDLIVDGGELRQQNISTVVKIIDRKIEVLRHGAIAESAIKSVITNS